MLVNPLEIIAIFKLILYCFFFLKIFIYDKVSKKDFNVQTFNNSIGHISNTQFITKIKIVLLNKHSVNMIKKHAFH